MKRLRSVAVNPGRNRVRGSQLAFVAVVPQHREGGPLQHEDQEQRQSAARSGHLPSLFEGIVCRPRHSTTSACPVFLLNSATTLLLVPKSNPIRHVPAELGMDSLLRLHRAGAGGKPSAASTAPQVTCPALKRLSDAWWCCRCLS